MLKVHAIGAVTVKTHAPTKAAGSEVALQHLLPEDRYFLLLLFRGRSLLVSSSFAMAGTPMSVRDGNWKGALEILTVIGTLEDALRIRVYVSLELAVLRLAYVFVHLDNVLLLERHGVEDKFVNDGWISYAQELRGV